MNYWWNDTAARYVDRRTGRFVSEATVRRWLDRTIRASEQRVAGLAQAVRAGDITVGEWHRAMREEMKGIHLIAAANAKGGWDRMTPSDFGRVGATLREEYRNLERFARQIERDLSLDGRFLRRAGMYVRRARGAYHDVETEERRDRGFDQERNVLGFADHCAGCIEATRQGWVPIGTLKPIGERDCLTECRCRITYRRSRAAGRRAA